MSAQPLPELAIKEESPVDTNDKLSGDLETRLQSLRLVVTGLAGQIDELPNAIFIESEAKGCIACRLQGSRETRYAEEISSVVNLWSDERKRHARTLVDLQRCRTLLHTTDAAYRSLAASAAASAEKEVEDPFISSELHHFHQWRHDLRVMGETLATRRLKIQERARNLILFIRRYEHFARNLRVELDRYNDWLDLRSEALHRNYERYCEIMAEKSHAPLLLYNSADAASLSRAKEMFLEASAQKDEAARLGQQAAYLDGRPDMLGDLYSV